MTKNKQLTNEEIENYDYEGEHAKLLKKYDKYIAESKVYEEHIKAYYKLHPELKEQ